MNRRETRFRDKQFIPWIETVMPQATILHQNSDVGILGIPDLIILNPFDHPIPWLAIELKRDKDSEIRENQEWWVKTLDRKGFAAFVHRDNFEAFKTEIEEILLEGTIDLGGWE